MKRAFKLPRPAHPDLDQVPYFVTTRTAPHRPVFVDHRLAAAAAEQLLASANTYGFAVLAYCFMPDHAHFVIVPGADRSISAVMRIVKGSIARRVNELTETNGSIWQNGFHDKVPRDLPALNEFIRYTEDNPVVAHLVDRPYDYPFSSARGTCRAAYDEFVNGPSQEQDSLEGVASASRAKSPCHGVEDAARDGDDLNVESSNSPRRQSQ